jgi:hypothetical protein
MGLWLEYYRQKTLHRDEPELAVIEVRDDLAAAIKEHAPTRKDRHGNLVPVVGASTFLVSDVGRFQYKEKHYGDWLFSQWVRKAGLPARITTHSLRRGQTLDLSYKGYSHEEINTIFKVERRVRPCFRGI